MLSSFAFTLLLLFALWALLQALVAWAIDITAYPWLETVVSIVAGVGSLVALAFLVAPVASIFAGLFSDRIAAVVEEVHYPLDRPGQDVPTPEAIRDTIAFTGVVLLVNLVALVLLFLPGVNAVAFLVGNGYLLGREYFEAVTRRHMSRQEARSMRLANRGKVFLGGLVIAALGAIPLVNLVTPLFATAFMLHLYKRAVSRGAGAMA